jgi:uracil-DNA glycosylase family 4
MTRLVMGVGPKPAPGMLLGEAPGATEEKVGEPFVGRAGRRLNEALEAASLPRDEIYITNVFKFRPPNNRPPNQEEVGMHLPILLNEFRQVQPKAILLLGRTAIQLYLGDAEQFIATPTIDSIRGVDLSRSDNLKVFGTYHPAATLYSPQYRDAFFEDVATFSEIIR